MGGASYCLWLWVLQKQRLRFEITPNTFALRTVLLTVFLSFWLSTAMQLYNVAIASEKFGHMLIPFNFDDSAEKSADRPGSINVREPKCGDTPDLSALHKAFLNFRRYSREGPEGKLTFSPRTMEFSPFSPVLDGAGQWWGLVNVISDIVGTSRRPLKSIRNQLHNVQQARGHLLRGQNTGNINAKRIRLYRQKYLRT